MSEGLEPAFMVEDTSNNEVINSFHVQITESTGAIVGQAMLIQLL
jgi:hypothetical protein